MYSHIKTITFKLYMLDKIKQIEVPTTTIEKYLLLYSASNNGMLAKNTVYVFILPNL